MLLMRFITLVADKLPEHPEAREPENRKALKAMIKAIPDVVQRLEVLKPMIVDRYETWQTALAKRKEAAETLGWDGFSARKRRSLEPSERDPAVAGKTKTLVAAEHGDLAVKLAHKEIRRRDDARRTNRGNSDTDQIGAGRNDDDGDLQRRMEDTRRRMDGARDRNGEGRTRLTKNRSPVRPPSAAKASSEYRYPSISKSQPLRYDEGTIDIGRQFDREILPPVPIKQPLSPTISFESQAPTRPAKLPQNEPPTSTPSPSDDASAFTFRPSAYLENGTPLRTLFLPTALRDTFLSIARPNTLANLETCGILCGTLISNALFISRLVIPEQESTSDTCETTNEGALFDYCDSEDLMVLGWIHTHPTQTCFMSSRDLHTHCGYQVMMPESIAIVCAPSTEPS
jgi:STAM-binding protein